ncbi:MAG: response regulator [Rhodospirillaceae bacterium]|nr:response regulator [Rhodospirillaceae bacterium]
MKKKKIRVVIAVILSVEDEMIVRLVAEMTLQSQGYRTLSAGDVDEALLLLRSPQHIDALFTDIYLEAAPLGGCTLAHQAVELRPDLRVLYATGNAATDQMKSLFVESAHFLPKPYSDEQLRDSMQGLLAA